VHTPNLTIQEALLHLLIDLGKSKYKNLNMIYSTLNLCDTRKENPPSVHIELSLPSKSRHLLFILELINVQSGRHVKH
jgi:hypothetical protein